MKLFILTIVYVLLYHGQIARGQTITKRLVCYYDAINTDKQSYTPHFVERFLNTVSNCTHLVYSYAKISAQPFGIRNFSLDLKPRKLKTLYPHLKIFLSVGCDKPERTQEYLNLLESNERQQTQFIENVTAVLKLNRFDGLDLAFPLPRNKPSKVHSGLGTAFKKFKKLFTGNEIVDASASAHKLQYTNFVRAVKREFLRLNLQLSMTVLPNVNSTWYFDVFKVHENFEFINLFAFDFLTPTRNPNEADYSAPIYFKQDGYRLPHYNIEFQVNYWIHNGCPLHKLNLGISSYGRAWKMTTDSGLSGIPVVENTNGAADAGKFSKVPGLLSWSEICLKLAKVGTLRKVVDAERKYGNYAFRPADKNSNNGIWISFDDPDFAGIKSEYVQQKGLGGVAFYSFHYDDFQGLCMGPPFPILSRIREVLGHISTHAT